jgi:hypothetical protein
VTHAVVSRRSRCCVQGEGDGVEVYDARERLPTRGGERDKDTDAARDRLQSRDKKRSDGSIAVPRGDSELDRDSRYFPNLQAQRMMAFPALMEDGDGASSVRPCCVCTECIVRHPLVCCLSVAGDDGDTSAFRRRVKDTIPMLGPAAVESKVRGAFLPASASRWSLRLLDDVRGV